MLAKSLSSATASAKKVYVEDVFATHFYTGTGSLQTITNDIDLAGEGGLVWIKSRSTAIGHALFDTNLAALDPSYYPFLATNTTAATRRANKSGSMFSSTGFSVGRTADGTEDDYFFLSGTNYSSWTFRKAKKFFDIVTYTGNGATSRTISHNLGSTPGMVIFKRTDGTGNWIVWHRSTPLNGYTQSFLRLNGTFSVSSMGDYGYSLVPTESVLNIPRHTNVSNTDDSVNVNGASYVAYVFAHDAGGFGDVGDQNIISCGSYTGNGSSIGPTVTLGYEPQWLLIKRTDASSSEGWWIVDVYRGLARSVAAPVLHPNLDAAEVARAVINITSTGFSPGTTNADVNASGGTYIYIAIRRGLMRTPTDASKVFKALVRTGSASTASVTTVGFPPDLVIGKARAQTYDPSPTWTDRLRGPNSQIGSSTTANATTLTNALTGFLMNGYTVGNDNGTGNYNLTTTTNNHVAWSFRRANKFFDIVYYTGTGSTRTVAHNLGVAPGLIIVRAINAGYNWPVYNQTDGASKYMQLNGTSLPITDSSVWNTAPTASVFTVGSNADANQNGVNYIAYLFGSADGVSKIGTYTGNGSGQTINCGFTGGAKFVVIKRTSAGNGDWYIFDDTRGIAASGDATLYFNKTTAESSSVDNIDYDASGFIVNQVGGWDINVNGSTYIYLAIA